MNVPPSDLLIERVMSSKQVPVALGPQYTISLRKVEEHGWVLEKYKYKKRYFFSLNDFSIKKKLWSKNNFVIENDPRLLLLFFCQALRATKLDIKLAEFIERKTSKIISLSKTI